MMDTGGDAMCRRLRMSLERQEEGCPLAGYTASMPIVFITGPIASGKSTVGRALATHWSSIGQPSAFVDLDEEVLKIHGSFDWDNEMDRTADWLFARRSAAKRANEAHAAGKYTVVSGPFYVQAEISGLTKHLVGGVPVFLYVLETSLALRLERHRGRAKVSRDSELIEQHEAIEALSTTFGASIRNNGSIRETVEEIIDQLGKGAGLLR